MLGKVYRIISYQGNKCYIGKTKNSLDQRFKEHLSHFKNKKIRTTCYEVLQYPDAKIELIEEVPITELSQREAYHIKENINTVNKSLYNRDKYFYCHKCKCQVCYYDRKKHFDTLKHKG